jgi:hypothetical protein
MCCGPPSSGIKILYRLISLKRIDRAIIISDDCLDVVDDLLAALDDPSIAPGVRATKASCCIASLSFSSMIANRGVDGSDCSGRIICSQFIWTLKPVDVSRINTFTA